MQFTKLSTSHDQAKKLLALLLLVTAINQVKGAVITLNDGGSTAIINTDSSAGMYHWDVGSDNQLNQQWFWYRIGSGLAKPINDISSSTIVFSSANTLVTSYANSQLSIQITYLLQGSGIGTGNADILETITAKNLSGGTLDLHLFQYSDFDLLGTKPGDSASSGAPSPIIQWEGSSSLSEATTLPPADRWEIGAFDTTRNSLNTVAGYDLANTPGIVTGDVTWAFQWDRTLGTSAIDDTIVISKDKGLHVEMVPEPSAMALIALGMTALGTFARRRNS